MISLEQAVDRALEHIECPICGNTEPEHFFTRNGNVIGCDACVDAVDPVAQTIDEVEKAWWAEVDRQVDERLGK